MDQSAELEPKFSDDFFMLFGDTFYWKFHQKVCGQEYVVPQVFERAPTWTKIILGSFLNRWFDEKFSFLRCHEIVKFCF